MYKRQVEDVRELLKHGLKHSGCIKHPVAAVLMLSDGKTLIHGSNGPPVGFSYCELSCPRWDAVSGENMQVCPSVHAEMDTVLWAARNGYSTDNSTLFISCRLPCKDCMKELISAGVRRIVSGYGLGSDGLNDGFSLINDNSNYSFWLSKIMMNECVVEYIHDPRIFIDMNEDDTYE